ncbi:DUF4389 domain-containing protein [Saccharophagus sp. K07]|uniref:DUF4389 domain-containing protein n=1 Tax=Saccharophagus sp. K07 TaxID=2283636 RepID=UPI0016524532|nr:DUF4389 domain-containing protein [Saccharophagus sp. K07]MBC6904748.1 DUF4389 domain-containing protein [Saccharophagus sp. K07]
MDPQLKSNLTSSKHWIRLIYMLLFAFFLYVASLVVGALVIVQFIFALITGTDNKKLRDFGWSLTQYIHQVLLFLTFNSEEKAFPFSDWPAPPAGEPEKPTEVVVTPAAPVAEPVVEPETAESQSTIIVPPPGTGTLNDGDEGENKPSN